MSRYTYPDCHSTQFFQPQNQLDMYTVNSQTLQAKPRKSSLEMLKISCEQLHIKSQSISANFNAENKTAETICSTYDRMSEVDALNILKKKVSKDTTHCHLWMFLFDILMDPKKSDVATWEDQKGMFRIRDPTKLAEMWGEKRNRMNMTYEKLSRSLRHYYEKKILRKVPKRKYTYKFNSREILKSYEVQPFYRRSNSNQSLQSNPKSPTINTHQGTPAMSIGQRSPTINTHQGSPANSHNSNGYSSGYSSGQCSPFTSLTPSPSYNKKNEFNWNLVPTYQQTWQDDIQSTQQGGVSPTCLNTMSSMVNQASLTNWNQQEQSVYCTNQEVPKPPPAYQQIQSVYGMTKEPAINHQDYSFFDDIIIDDGQLGIDWNSQKAAKTELGTISDISQQRQQLTCSTFTPIDLLENMQTDFNVFSSNQNSCDVQSTYNGYQQITTGTDSCTNLDDDMLYDLVESLVRDSGL